MASFNRRDGVSFHEYRSKSSRRLTGRSLGPRLELLEARIVLAAGPLITEFLAVNSSTIADGDGLFSDWIEIHNPTSSPVNLEGWHLTDDRSDLGKWPFPNIGLDSGEYLVVFASGQEVDNYVDREGHLHTNFRLSGAGEDLLLVEPDGVTYDSTFLDYPEQSTDVSFGISIDGVTEKLVDPAAEVSYRVPTAAEHPTEWTAVDFDDRQFTSEQTVAGSGLLITEVTTGSEINSLEIQNVSGTIIEADGWIVAINDPSAGPSGVANDVWNLPPTVEPSDILYRTDHVTDQYWGSPIPWQLDGPGWAMILDDNGEVQDTIVWGYTAAQIATIQIDVGSHNSISIADYWDGDGASVGASGGVITDPVSIGPGAELDGATNVDSAGVRLNIEPEFVQRLSAGTYDVQEISMAASSNGRGTLRAFLAVLTGGTAYETIWVSPETVPAAGDTVHNVSYSPGTQQFTIATDLDVYSGVWHDGDAKIRFNNSATITNHDNNPITPTAPGQAISDFSHGTLNDRTYAYEVTVGTGGGETAALVRTGVFDRNTASDFVRSGDATIGTQNLDSAPLFGGVVPTIAGVGMSDGGPVLKDLIQTDVTTEMLGRSASLWTRFEFNSPDLTSYDELTLRIRYDDGFRAYLDGVPLVSRNTPQDLSFDSMATTERSRFDALSFEQIDVADSLSQLSAGAHVLAIHLLNASIADPDLLLQLELLAGTAGIGQFFADATPGQASVAAGFNTVADTNFSVDRGFYESPVSVAITTATADATIVYTLDGTPPEVGADGSIRNGFPYESPLNIGSTTTLRAMAFKQGLQPSNIDTQTYLFTDDIIRQTRESTIAAGFPSSWGGRGADYGLDPEVIGPNDSFDGIYAESVADDLKTLPTLSLVMDIDDMFGSRGIYANAGSRGRAWERPVSAELIYPDGTEGFQIDAGIRVHGGASRSLSRKNNLRLLFREEYGDAKLDYPLFGDGVERFDTMVLRAHFNDGWGWDGAGSDPLFARDQWHRQTQAAMGHTSAGGMYAHLYINGVYWGIYNPSERPDASFAAQHFGGDKTEWDAMNHNGVVDGSSSAWNTMRSRASAVNSASGSDAKWAAYQRLQGNDPDGNNDPSREAYLDIDNYIDYLLLSFYSGNDDWPNRNWYAARRRGVDSEGFQFFAWDSEISMDLSGRTNLNENVIRDANNGPNGVADPYGSLRRYEEFQIAFADRVHRHFFNGGVFYVDPDNPSWDPDHPERNVPAAKMVEITNMVSRAIVPESARWGDQHRSRPYTRNAEWQNSLDHLLDDFFPRRTSIVMNQLRSNDLYPNTEAPEFEADGVRQHGGTVTPGTQIGLVNPNGDAGAIWFTVDGSDPRLPGGAINSASATRFTSPIELTNISTLKARVLNGSEWSALSEAAFAFDQRGVRISEIHFNPAAPNESELAVDPTFDNDDFEFIELVNVGESIVILDGAEIIEGVQFDFSNALAGRVAPAERIVIVRNVDAFSTRYADTLDSITIAGQYDGVLRNNGETLKATDVLGNVFFEFEYDDDWYDQTDGEGYSLTVRNPSDRGADLNLATSWRPSSLPGGSPGEGDSAIAPSAVVINELLATSDGSGWVELHNTTPEPIDIGHWYLSDAADQLQKYQFEAGTIIPANGFFVVDETTQFGAGNADPGALVPFALSRHGGRLYLSGGDDQSRLLGYREDQTYSPVESEVAQGRLTKSTGATDFVRLQSPTPGAANADPMIGPLVIHEIMYHPTSEETEFIELVNTSDVSITLSRNGRPWRIRGAIDFDLPIDASIQAGGFGLLLQQSPNGDPASDAAEFRRKHGIEPSIPIWTYSSNIHGSLNNDGEKIFLEAPADDAPSNSYLTIDAVRYNDRSPWPLEPDGTGPSLSRLEARAYGNDVVNWGVSTDGGTPGRENVFRDVTPPTLPTNLRGRIENETTVSLAWTAATDDQSGIDHYRIYRDGQAIGTSILTRFTGELQFSSGQLNQYRVSAVNGDGIEGEVTAEFVDFSIQTADFQHGVHGYRGGRDSEIREGNPNSNNGLTDTELEVDGEDGGTELSILIGWNDLSIPDNVVVVGALMTFEVANSGDQYAVHQMRRDWDEGQVTWNNADADQRWETAGARGSSDRGPQVGELNGAIGTVVVDLNDAGVAMVQSWLANPANNFGVSISNTGQATNGVDLFSREHPTVSQRPKLSIQFAPASTPAMLGDFNLDDTVNAADIDMLATAIRIGSNDPAFNIDGMGVVDSLDHDYLLREVLRVPFGDSTLDGIFDSADLVAVFQAGLYEDNIAGNAGWAAGDWNGDGDFDTQDLVKAFQEGSYVQAARPIAWGAQNRLQLNFTEIAARSKIAVDSLDSVFADDQLVEEATKDALRIRLNATSLAPLAE